MIPNPEFQRQSKSFWAYVRTISQSLGYTVRNQGIIKIPTSLEIIEALSKLGLDPGKVVGTSGELTPLGRQLKRYFHYRAGVLNDFVQHQLMNVEAARKTFEQLQRNGASRALRQ